MAAITGTWVVICSQPTSAALRAAGRQVALLSGDAAPVALKVAQALDIAEVHGGISPQGKHDYVRRLQAGGAIVAMIGVESGK